MTNPQKYILASSEMRWFHDWDKKDFQSVLTWLQSILEDLDTEPIREDYYLRTGNYDKGIKLRPYSDKTHLELKFLLAQENRTILFKGRKENWTKWSIPLPLEFDVDVKKDPKWIEVEKSRYLIKISFDHLSPIVFSTTENSIREGCNVELTRLKIKEIKYWSFGLESFSSSMNENKNLEAGLEFLSLNNPPEIIQTGISCGYMEWLIKEVL